MRYVILAIAAFLAGTTIGIGTTIREFDKVRESFQPLADGTETNIVREVKSLIIGESADPLVHAAIERFISDRPEVDRVLNLITLQWGDHVVVAVKARMKESRDVGRLLEEINACEAALKQQFPEVSWVFFEPDAVD